MQLLALSEDRGMELRNCPAYVREWVTRERTESEANQSEQATEGNDDGRTSDAISRPLPSLGLKWSKGEERWHFLNSLDPATASRLFLNT